jgi:hypothetical protein
VRRFVRRFLISACLPNVFAVNNISLMNPGNDFDADLLHAVIRVMPILMACAAGFVLALVFRTRHRLASGLVLAGTMLLFLGQGINLYWEHVFIPEVEMQGQLPETLDALVLYGLPYVYALGVLLLLAAAFVGRHESHAPPHFYGDE